MRVSNGDVFQAREPLQRLLGEKFPMKTAIALRDFKRKLAEKWDVIEDIRLGLVKEYGETDDKGQTTVKQGTEKWDKFVTEFNDLMAMDCEIDGNKVVVPLTGNVMVSAADMEALDKFIEVG